MHCLFPSPKSLHWMVAIQAGIELNISLDWCWCNHDTCQLWQQQYAWHWWTLQFGVTYLEEEFVESVVWGNWESRDNRLCGHQTDHERRTYDLRIHIQIVLLVQPILVYMSKVDGKFLFSPVSVNFLTEVVKVFFAICMLLWQVCAFVWALMCFILLFYEWVHHICSEGWWSEILYVSFPG